jgi:predicted amidohydrolase YtcJ
MFRLLMMAILGLALVGCADEAPSKAGADLVLYNARIYTVDAERSWAQAVAIKDGVLVYVGDDAGVAAHQDSTTRAIDMQGKFLLPSFQDVHIHPVAAGVSMLGCPVYDLAGLAEILETIRSCVEDKPEQLYIEGTGWTWDQFSDPQGPDKELLDAIDSERPLAFRDADGHSIWLNSAALKLAGITAATEDPAGGKIGRDELTGEPTGLLLEDPAMNLWTAAIPPPSAEILREGIIYAQRFLNSLGITAVQDAIVKLDGRDAYVSLPAYRALADSDELSLRVVASLYWEPSQGMEQIDDLIAARKKYSNGRLQATTVKFWADGIIETHTAMLLDPYSDAPETRGLLMVPREQLMSAVPVLDKAGFQMHIHTIGTATVRYALDAIEAAQQANGKRDGRHHIAHVQLVHPQDIPRFGELDVTASFQPLWAYADEYATDINPPQLGPERMQWFYPIASIANSGGKLAFGSDWFVSTPNPFPAMEVAVTRQDPETSSTPALSVEEGISLEQAVAGYTIGAARINFLDHTTGSIEVGKFADMIVVDRNLFEIPVSEVSEASVLVTLLEGEEVYGELL